MVKWFLTSLIVGSSIRTNVREISNHAVGNVTIGCTVLKVGAKNMGELDYKKQIIDMIENTDDEEVLAYLYFFIKGKVKAED